MNLAMWGAFAGGVGLFLLGMSLMTQGLMQAAGPSLRRILHAATASPGRGLLSGFGATAIVQSSSAVTVATIGFVNAELMALSQAIPVIFGSNVGTTITGWLVATLGFKVKVEVFALPMIGIGMAFRVIRGQRPLGRLGEALAGFGLFFIGVDVLKEAFEGFAATTDLARYSGMGIRSVLLFVVVGVVLTTLLQSSSASMAMILTAASGGLVSIEDAAALVIGANVGTTTTAMLSVIGASPAAKRLAAAHVLFNLITGAVGLLILPIMLFGIRQLQGVLGGQEDLSLLLALFHTFFNVFGVLLLWVHIGRMTAFLQDRFRAEETERLRPVHLDPTLAKMPVLAMVAAGRELARGAERAHGLAVSALNSEIAREPSFEQQLGDARQLLTSIGDYLSLVQRGVLQPAQIDSLRGLTRSLAEQHVLLDALAQMKPLPSRLAEKLPGALSDALESGRRETLQLLENIASGEKDPTRMEQLTSQNKSLQRKLKKLRKQLLGTAGDGTLDVPALLALGDRIDHLRDLADHATRTERARIVVEEIAGLMEPADAVPSGAVAPAPAA